MKTAVKNMLGQGTNLMRLFSLNREFSNELHKFLYPPEAQEYNETSLTISKKDFPYFLREETIQVEKVALIFKLKDGVENSTFNDYQFSISKDDIEKVPSLTLKVEEEKPEAEEGKTDAVDSPKFGGLPWGESEGISPSADGEGEWQLKTKAIPATDNEATRSLLNEVEIKAIEDIYLLFYYTIKEETNGD
jgi:hypothetical protein